MRTIEIETGLSATGWTIEVQDELERKIAVSLGRDTCSDVTDEEVKNFIMKHLMESTEMLSLEVVKE